MPITLDGSNGITTPTYGGADTSEYLVPVTQFKNRIINGAMVIDQRNAGASVTPSSTSYTVDRWALVMNGSGTSKLSIQQSSTAPAGFNKSVVATVVSSYSPASNDVIQYQQPIEGFNMADLNWGTANAKTITISFWVQSSLTGTYSVMLLSNGTGGTYRNYIGTYTINSANTWEQKSITIAGDTSGTWDTGNTTGVYVAFDLGSGSGTATTAGSWANGVARKATGANTFVSQSNGATFYITGVQLEVGSTATSFDYRPYGTELALCQRYAYVVNTTNYPTFTRLGVASAASGTTARIGFPFPVTMRATPSLTYSGTARLEAASAVNITGITFTGGSAFSFGGDISVASGLTAAGAYVFDIGSNASLTISAEL